MEESFSYRKVNLSEAIDIDTDQVSTAAPLQSPVFLLSPLC